MNLDVIRTITIQGKAEGLDALTASVNKLADAQGNVAIVSDTVNKTGLSVADAYQKQTLRIDAVAMSQSKVAAQTKIATAAFEQGILGDKQGADAKAALADRLDLINKKYGEGAAQSKVFAAATSGVSAQLIALSAGAGPVGVFLAALGPWGMAAAVGLGSVEGIFSHMADEAKRLGEEARGIKEFGDNVNLTSVQIQALGAAASDAGIPQEKLRTGIERLSASMEALRLGTGTALDQIRRIDPVLSDQLMRTKDTATAINLIAQAWERADIAQRNALSRATMGRNLSMGLVLGQVAEAGGVDPLTKQMQDRIVLTNQQTEEFAKQQVIIDALKKHAMDLMASLWTGEVQSAQREAADLMDRMANRMKEMKDAAGGGWWTDFWVKVGQVGGGQQMVGVGNQPRTAGLPADNLRQVGSYQLQGVPPEFMGGNVPMPQGRPAMPDATNDPLKLEATTAAYRTMVSALGAAVTQSEQFRMKQLELDVLFKDKKITLDTYNRGLAEFKIAQDQANEAAKQSLGVANENEISKSKMITLDQQIAKGLQLTNAQHDQAVAIIQKEAKAQAEANQVRASALPGLKQMELDYGNLNKQLDTMTTGSLNQLTTSLADITTGTKSASQAFTDMGNYFIRAIEEMIIKIMVIQPLAAALQATLGGPGGFLGLMGLGGSSGLSLGGNAGGRAGMANGGVFDQGHMIHPYALGGIMSDIVTKPTFFPMANGAGLMGEAGPEAIMPLRRGSDGRLGVAGAGGGGSNVTVNVHNAPAGVESTKTTQGANGMTIDLILRKMDDRMVSNFKDRGHPVTRAAAGTFGANLANGIA